MSIKMKVVLTLLALGVIAASVFSVFSYRVNMSTGMRQAQDTADLVINRAVQMFMVSTKKFHEEFQKHKNDPKMVKKVLEDWNRTIFAVDEAVITRESKARVRLIGDTKLFGIKPLGKENTKIIIPFESIAGKALIDGEKFYSAIEEADARVDSASSGEVLRFAVPLPSQAHRGCAECHFAEIEGLQADMTRNMVFGTLNAYVPLEPYYAAARSSAITSIIFLVGALAGIMVLLFFLISRSVVKPIRGLAGSLNSAANEVSNASVQVSNSSQSLAQGSGEQAASLEETSASMEEMSSMTNQNTENAKQADTMMKQVEQIVVKANTDMQKANEAMEKIIAASDETAKIIKTIDEIAFQTNLLALNAAVEAARAGEAGAGFAVVADEVRALAMRAAEAASNTSELIQENIQNIKLGSELVRATDDTFSEVRKSAAKVAGLISEISAASVEQSQGIGQTNKAMSDMDKVTQNNAATAEESASAAEQLQAQAMSVNNLVERLLDIVDGYKNKSMNPRQQKKIGLSEDSPRLERPPANSKDDGDDFKDF